MANHEAAGLRIGHGFDAHRLVEGRKLILGGIEVPHDKGLAGHSDADVLLHAIADALLGAAALGDIGQHFPPSNDKYKDADSAKLLAEVVRLIRRAGFTSIGNVDCIVMAENPKLAPHIPAMREKIAAVLGITIEQIGIKATTTERLGFVGREEGIAASAVCLVSDNE
jgi:2-C-methyl-D-erythritol 2,4-cyclodiphosphate synthase